MTVEVARFSKPARRAVSGYLPNSVDRPGNRTPISWLQARHLPVGRAAHVLSEVRLGIEPSLPPYHSGVQPQHLQTKSDPGWNRTITFLDVAQAGSCRQ
jgi:hypothetical protein